MTNAELVKVIADEVGKQQTEIDRIITAITEQIKKQVAAGDEVKFGSLGKFTLANKAAREGRNPQTGEKIKIKASKGMKFKPSKDVKDTLNKK